MSHTTELTFTENKDSVAAKQKEGSSSYMCTSSEMQTFDIEEWYIPMFFFPPGIL